MFVRIAIDQSVSLHDADEFGQLSVQVAGLDSAALRSALRRHRLGRVDDQGDVELRVATLKKLAGDRDEQWGAAFVDMLGYARSKGWMAGGEHVRAHCVPIPAVPVIWSS